MLVFALFGEMENPDLGLLRQLTIPESGGMVMPARLR
jgi:hypothetical protein